MVKNKLDVGQRRCDTTWVREAFENASLTTRGCLFGHTKGNPLLANDVSFQILFVRLRSEHIQAVGKPVKIILGAIMAYSFRISISGSSPSTTVKFNAFTLTFN